jgi:hypothetical protein
VPLVADVRPTRQGHDPAPTRGGRPARDRAGLGQGVHPCLRTPIGPAREATPSASLPRGPLLILATRAQPARARAKVAPVVAVIERLAVRRALPGTAASRPTQERAGPRPEEKRWAVSHPVGPALDTPGSRRGRAAPARPPRGTEEDVGAASAALIAGPTCTRRDSARDEGLECGLLANRAEVGIVYGVRAETRGLVDREPEVLDRVV